MIVIDSHGGPKNQYLLSQYLPLLLPLEQRHTVRQDRASPLTTLTDKETHDEQGPVHREGSRHRRPRRGTWRDLGRQPRRRPEVAARARRGGGGAPPRAAVRHRLRPLPPERAWGGCP